MMLSIKIVQKMVFITKCENAFMYNHMPSTQLTFNCLTQETLENGVE